MTAQVYIGDAREVLSTLPASSVHCVVTSPPYWQLRDYGHEDQLGLEESLDDFLENLCRVFDEVTRVLRPDGTCWVNLGDCYLGGRSGGMGKSALSSGRNHEAAQEAHRAMRARGAKRHRSVPGLPRKSLVGVPWRFAFAMQARGWVLRSEVIWQKPNAMPETPKDRPTRDHEHVFLFARQPVYYYDPDPIRTPIRPKTRTAYGSKRRRRGPEDALVAASGWDARAPARKPAVDANGEPVGANARTVWSISQDRWIGIDVSPLALDEICRRFAMEGPHDGTR